jgi:glycerophosphoryl diester phosphodiesterase
MLAPAESYPTKRAPGCLVPPRPLSTRLLRLIPGDSRSRRAPIELQSVATDQVAGRHLAIGLCPGGYSSEVVVCVGEGGRFRPDFFVDLVGAVDEIAVAVYALESEDSFSPVGVVSLEGAGVVGFGLLGVADFSRGSVGCASCSLFADKSAHAPVVGRVTLEYLVVTPFYKHVLSNDGDGSSSGDDSLGTVSDDTAAASGGSETSSYTPPLFAGHRGLGQCSTTTASENSILSFLEATSGDIVKHVELDVQLTADGVPVVHHDWERGKKFLYTIESKDNTDIPTLEEVCESLPSHVGLLVDVKYPPLNVQRARGVPVPDRNLMADRILDALFSASNTKRAISLLSFDADLCTMFRLKQHLLPVCLLHCEERDGPDCDDADPRTTCVERGIEFACSHNFDGMVLFAEMVMEDRTLARRVASHGLSVMTYSDLNADADTALLQLKELGVQGLIADDVVRVADVVTRSLSGQN